MLNIHLQSVQQNRFVNKNDITRKHHKTSQENNSIQAARSIIWGIMSKDLP